MHLRRYLNLFPSGAELLMITPMPAPSAKLSSLFAETYTAPQPLELSALRND